MAKGNHYCAAKCYVRIQNMWLPFGKICLSILPKACLWSCVQGQRGSCRVEITLSPGWTNGKDNSTIVSIDVNVFNTGPVAIAVPWILTLNNRFYGAVQQVWLCL